MPEGITWTKPEGGLFLWIRLPESMSSTELFEIAIDNDVAYVIGAAFHHDRSGENTMRMNFSFPSEEQIVDGVKRLAKAIKKKM
jgi:2-aminoadipate transaminase